MKAKNILWPAVSICLPLLLLFAANAMGGQYAELAFFTKKAKAAPLQSYNVDPAMVSVSGLSSGGFMAAQLGIAHSSVFTRGFGVFAGGPYDCARNQKYTDCMANSVPDISIPQSNMARWSGSRIDPVENLAGRRIFLWAGAKDSTVGPNVTEMLYKELSQWCRPDKAVLRIADNADHTFPTDFDSPGNNPCHTGRKPHISNCGYDGAGEVLKWLYGDLKVRNVNPPSRIISFDQTAFIDQGRGMDVTGYLFVPADCAAGWPCRLHVALHGCGQSYSSIQMRFVNNTGYNRWADTNRIIVLYPQARPDYLLRRTWSSGYLPNPAGCWDWVGWYGENADYKGGTQLEAIVGMVKRITSGHKQ